VFIRSLHWPISWARSIQSIPPHTICLRSLLILSTHLRLGHSNVSSGFLTNIPQLIKTFPKTWTWNIILKIKTFTYEVAKTLIITDIDLHHPNITDNLNTFHVTNKIYRFETGTSSRNILDTWWQQKSEICPVITCKFKKTKKLHNLTDGAKGRSVRQSSHRQIWICNKLTSGQFST
jgi:hypothetical protein